MQDSELKMHYNVISNLWWRKKYILEKKVHIGEKRTYWRRKYILEKKVHIGEESTYWRRNEKVWNKSVPFYHRKRSRDKRRQRWSPFTVAARMIWRKVLERKSIFGGWGFGLVRTRRSSIFSEASILSVLLFIIFLKSSWS